MRLLRFTLRRLLLLIPVLLAATFIAFALTRVLPGNPIDRVVSPYTPPERREELKRQAGLDQPFYVQFVVYLGNLLRGDMGVSYTTAQPVTYDLFSRLPATFELMTYSMILALALGIPIGVASAIYRNSWIDHLGRIVSVIGVSMPVFWLALVLLFVFFYQLEWAPAPLGRINALLDAPPHITGWFTIDALLIGDWTVFRSAVASLVLPVLTVAFTAMAPIARMTRSSMIEALQSDYVRTATALGLPRGIVVYRHAFKNALLPILTISAAVYGYGIGGEVLVEYIFAWPGLGLYTFNAILASDFPAIQGAILVMTASYVLIYLLVDLAQAVLDPRVEL